MFCENKIAHLFFFYFSHFQANLERHLSKQKSYLDGAYSSSSGDDDDDDDDDDDENLANDSSENSGQHAQEEEEMLEKIFQGAIKCMPDIRFRFDLCLVQINSTCFRDTYKSYTSPIFFKRVSTCFRDMYKSYTSPIFFKRVIDFLSQFS